MAGNAAVDTMGSWHSVCRVEDIVEGSGVAARLGVDQIALFRVDGIIYAVDHRDPRSGACVIARGIVGDRDGELKVASPMFKQSFSLVDGRCLDDDGPGLRTWEVRIVDGVVEVLA